MTGNSSEFYRRNAFRRLRSEASSAVKKGIEILDIVELLAMKRAMMQTRAFA